MDDVIRNELHLSSDHAFEDCIHRQPMVQEMCVRDYVSKYMDSGKARQRAESNKRTSETIGWMQRFEDSETAYFTSADDFVKALKVELTLHPENTDWGVLKDEAAIQKAVFDETGKVTGEGNPFYIDELGNDIPDSVKGRIIDLSTAELIEYRKSEDYLEAIRDKLLYGTDGFQFETVTENSAVWKALDDEVNAAFGTYDEDGIEHSLARPRVSGFVTFAEFVEKRMRTDDGTLEHSHGELRDNQINMNECNVDMEVITECKCQNSLRKADTDIVKVSSDDLPFPDGKIKPKVPNKQKQNYRIKTKPEKKRSVLARLAEKQAIVKERNRGSKSIANKESIQIAK